MSKFYFKPIIKNKEIENKEIENKEIENQKDAHYENEIEGTIEEDKDIIIPHIDHPIVESEEPVKIKSLPDLNEAQERNKKGDPPASIITTACGIDGSNNECFYKNDCPILNAYDKIIYERLEKDEVIAIEVRWCHKYRPKYKYR